MRILIIFLCSCILSPVTSKAHQDTIPPIVTIQTCGVRINVTDMDIALDFYHRKLGFPILSRLDYPKSIELNDNAGRGRLTLNLVGNLLKANDRDTKASITFQVNDYDSAYKKFKEKGIDFGDNTKQKEGVGYAIQFSDPFGTKLYMMQVTAGKQEKFVEPRVYNFGIEIPDMNSGRFFFKQLGLVERSLRYLPLDMPLGHPDQSFAFMLHEREGIEPLHYNSTNDEHVVILFKTTELSKAMEKMKKAGIAVFPKLIQERRGEKFISFRDSFGLVYELIEEQ